ncbi:MAG: metallophosphoesterase [Eubacterium sp.]|jgi:predicted phosphohydrolase
MALYALGDLHLNFQTPGKSMTKFGRVWRKHEEKIKKYCSKLVRSEDTLVLTGDHSWGKKLAYCEQDLAFIAALPGRKILLRGNHDMFWEVRKTETLNRQFAEQGLHFLQNNYYTYQDYALVGTKGYTFEGPFYLDGRGRILSWDESEEAHAEKLVRREAERLRASFEQAAVAGYQKYVMFLHYPPTNILEKSSIFTELADEYGVSHVVYSHSHGASRFHDSILGRYHQTEYHLVSGDYLNFHPEKILD